MVRTLPDGTKIKQKVEEGDPILDKFIVKKKIAKDELEQELRSVGQRNPVSDVKARVERPYISASNPSLSTSEKLASIKCRLSEVKSRLNEGQRSPVSSRLGSIAPASQSKTSVLNRLSAPRSTMIRLNDSASKRRYESDEYQSGSRSGTLMSDRLSPSREPKKRIRITGPSEDDKRNVRER